jgi:hypothetical protein
MLRAPASAMATPAGGDGAARRAAPASAAAPGGGARCGLQPSLGKPKRGRGAHRGVLAAARSSSDDNQEASASADSGAVQRATTAALQPEPRGLLPLARGAFALLTGSRSEDEEDNDVTKPLSLRLPTGCQLTIAVRAPPMLHRTTRLCSSGAHACCRLILTRTHAASSMPPPHPARPTRARSSAT